MIVNRWAAVLALSNLASEKPERHIAKILLECMSHRDERVRKVAAYEARPTLLPEEPAFAARILSLALDDSQSEVRRDACRRILKSATTGGSAYTVALLSLRQKLLALAATDFYNAELIRAAIVRLELTEHQ